MTNISGEQPPKNEDYTLTLGGYVQEVQSIRGVSEEAVSVTGDHMSGAIYRYEITVDDFAVGGMMNTLTGRADVEVRDIHTGDLVIHGDEISIDRIGLARFEHKPVGVRSLATLALRAATWARGADNVLPASGEQLEADPDRARELVSRSVA